MSTMTGAWALATLRRMATRVAMGARMAASSGGAPPSEAAVVAQARAFKAQRLAARTERGASICKERRAR